MKSDIQALMKKHDIAALLVTGRADHNPAMVYLTGGAHLTTADILLKAGQKGMLFCNGMEREEAAKTGFDVQLYSQFPVETLLEETKGDRQRTGILRYKKMFERAGIKSGKVALYGEKDLGTAYIQMAGLQQQLPEVELVGNLENDVLMLARETKDTNELARIRKMADITQQVVGNTADFLTSCQVKHDTLMKPDGTPLTIGEVKHKINLWLAERGAENPEGTIFAIGRDAGVPHSTGNNSDVITLGKTIVFDIFPCEQGGGYFYDFTRTWSLGYATDEVLQAYEQVHKIYFDLVKELKTGERFSTYQEQTCKFFESHGHPTIMNQPDTNEGYVHSIGHGLGLNVHERPFSSMIMTPDHTIQPGSVFTIEPGLYYPDKGFGIRLEDTFVALPDCSFERLSDYPLDLVLPVKQ